MPITVRPGMVATRADTADMLRAISSASWITRLALMPLAGSSSYIVTTGPGRTFTIAPFTWKSSSTDSSSRALRSSAALSIAAPGVGGAGLSRLTGGSAVLSPRSNEVWRAFGAGAGAALVRSLMTGAARGSLGGTGRGRLSRISAGASSSIAPPASRGRRCGRRSCQLRAPASIS